MCRVCLRDKELHWMRHVCVSLCFLRCRCTEPVWLVWGSTSTGFVQCTRANRFEQGARAHELVRVSVGFCAVRAHKSFVQCACTMSSCPRGVLVWNQYSSWVEDVQMSWCVRACASVLVCESVYRGAHVREPVPLYGVGPPGLCTMFF